MSEYHVVTMPPGVAANAETKTLTIAVVTLNLDPASPTIVAVNWLHDFFKVPLPAELRQIIVKHLRYHADRLESGDLDKRMEELCQLCHENAAGPNGFCSACAGGEA